MTDLSIAGPKPAISEIEPTQLAAWLDARGEPAYRAAQVLDGAHRSGTASFEDLTELPAPLRAALADEFRFTTIADSHVIGADGGLTAKAVHELSDGQRIESVLMRYPARGRSHERTTICISSQAGCAVNCPFCATGQAGFGRQLTPGEIVDQVLHWHRPPWNALGDGARGHYNIVFMGMGEPLNNADSVFEAVRLLNDPARLGIGARHITVSTSGVVPGMDRMIDELPQVNLAISLHAATDALRDELVPINRKWPIREVVGAGRRFAARTGRRVSLEYVMIDGLNDTDEQASRARASSRAAGAPTSTSSRSTRRPARAGAGRRRPGSPASPGSCATATRRHRARHARPRDRGGLRAAPRSARRPVPARGARGACRVAST